MYYPGVEEAAMARILVVDREPATGSFVYQLVRPWGHQVVATTDPRDALTKLMRRDFDLVMIDEFAPEIDAVEFLDRLDAMPSRDKTHVLVITGRGRHVDPILASRAHVAGTVCKPFVSAEVEQAMAKALQRDGRKARRDIVLEAELFEVLTELQELARASEDDAPTRPRAVRK